MDEEKIEKLTESLIQKFLKEEDKIFLTFYENFIKNLSTFCTNNKFDFKKILEKFAHGDCANLSLDNIEDVKRILLYSICLNKSDLFY